MPEPINYTKCIEFLVRRRFPNVGLLVIRPSSSGQTPAPDTTKLREDVAAFRAELATLPLNEVLVRYHKEQAKEGEEIRQRRHDEERKMFYSQPHSNADYDHWSRAAHWTLDEAIALSFGKAPEVVHWDQLKKFTGLGSPFVTQYARRRDLALRAVTWQQLYDPVLPGIFLAWAKRTDIAVPPELMEAVQKRGVQVADWKSLYDEADKAHKRAIASVEAEASNWKGLYHEAMAELNKEHLEWLKITDEKNAQIAALELRISEATISFPEQELGARSKDSLLKLVIGMAVVGYGYDPKAARSDRPAEITGDLERAGVPLDVDTVRKWLREAAELLPPK